VLQGPEDKLGPDHPLPQVTRKTILQIEALELHQRVLDDTEVELGENNWLVGIVMVEISNLYLKIGDENEALS
jgi:hypothetical protein